METLKKIFGVYRDKFIQPKIIDGIRQREIDNDFPFSVHNMMRAFLNLAPYFFEGFYRYYKTHELNNLDVRLVHKKFGTATRVYRYTLFLIIGAWLENDISWDEKLGLLNYVARVLDYKMSNDVLLPREEFEKLSKLVSEEKKEKINSIDISSLAIYLKEYVDFIFLGEHPLGYTTYPPTRIGHNTLVVRKFYNLNYKNLIANLKNVTIANIYDNSVEQNMSFDLFRGNLYGVPSYKQGICGVVSINDKQTEDLKQIKKNIGDINKALKKRSTYYRQNSSNTLEVEQAFIYSTELTLMFDGKLPTDIEENIKNVVYLNKIGDALLRKYKKNTYTDVYFCVLSDAIDNIEKNINNK